MSQPVDITIVLCTFNRAAWLPDVIASLTSQETAGAFSYELLIVDNASSDNTPKVAKQEMAATNLPIRYVCEQTPGVSAARNCGIREAHGEWIAFCDDDQLADSNWLAELFALAKSRECRVVGGAVHLVRADHMDEGKPLGAQANERLSIYLERLLAPGGRSVRVQRFHRRDALNSGNQMVHQSVFEEVGVYNEDCREGGEDTDWFLRLLARHIDAWFTPTAAVRHLVPDYRLSVDYLRWVSLRQGWGTARHQVEGHGLWRAGLVGLARVGQAGLQHAPQLLLAKITGQADHMLYRRCRLWRVAGFSRFLLGKVLPGMFPQHHFRSWIEFRGEREQFTPNSNTPAVAR